MKKFLLVSTIVLMAAVAFLYYEYYSYIKSDKHQIDITNAAASNTLKIAYFDLDTLQDRYEYFKQVRDYLNGKDSQNQTSLNQMRDNYLNKVKEYNQKGPTMNQQQQSDFEQQLMKMKNDYDLAAQNLNQEMQTESIQKMQEVRKKIQDFLKTYCRDKGYAYAFASEENDSYIYYKDTIRNITNDLVKQLNVLYLAEKKK